MRKRLTLLSEAHAYGIYYEKACTKTPKKKLLSLAGEAPAYKL